MNPKSVLVIEDDPAIRETLRVMLEMENYPVLHAANGREALDVLSQKTLPGIILVDLMMPVMNGWEFIEALEKNKQFAGIPVFVVTAFSENMGNLPQVQGVIKKPIDIDSLLERVKQYCG